ncbi:MAG: T9SS type A sorting domain-containing protein, partial [Bacteroidales bacterium]|nr:T9SS type A sorting domain-containing protein [Bacteroidales bacterium]
HYVFEYFIAWSDLMDINGSEIVPGNDLVIGFDIYGVDNDGPENGAVRNRLVWSNDGSGSGATENWNNLDDAGRITLAGQAAHNKKSATIYATTTQIKVDGTFDELAWNTVPAHQMKRVYAGETINGAEDYAGSWKALWNEDGIFIAVEILDDVLKVDGSYGQAWEQDKIEVYFDMNTGNIQDGIGAEGKQGHYQIAPVAISGTSNWGSMSSYSIVVQEANCNYEFFVAWSDLLDTNGERIHPMDNLAIGFDVVGVDNDGEEGGNGKVRNRLVWSNDGNGPSALENWKSQDDAGLLNLAGSLPFYQKNATALVAEEPIVIDGIFDDTAWSKAYENEMTRPFIGESFSGIADYSGSWKVVWDNDGIYVAVCIKDDVLYVEGTHGQAWEKDKIEVYFDMNTEQLADGLGAEGKQGHYQVAPTAVAGNGTWGAASSYSITLDGSNCNYEFFIAWSDLPDMNGNIITPGNDLNIGFDVVGVDNDGPDNDNENVRNRLVWCNNGEGPSALENWKSLDDAGLLKLEGDAGYSKKSAVAKITEGEVVLDGVLDDVAWENAEEYVIARPFFEESFSGDTDYSGSWKAIWNGSGIYVGVTINDDVIYVEGDHGQDWEKDKVEVYFDMNSDLLMDGLGAEDKQGHFQLAPKAITGDGTWGASSSYSILVDGTNVTYEFFVSWSDLPDFDGKIITPGNNLEIGFDVVGVDNDGPENDNENVRNRMVWCNNGEGPSADENWSSLDDAGTLKLVGEYVPGGMYNVNVRKLSVYPNPVNNKTIYLSDSFDTIEIFSISGSKILTVKNYQKNTRIDVSSFKNGIYFIKNNKSRVKFIVKN